MESMRQMMTVLQRAIPDVGVWWPAETKFEILVGAVLVQNTTWTNTETALANLRTLNLLTPETLAAADSAVVQDASDPQDIGALKPSICKPSPIGSSLLIPLLNPWVMHS